MTSTFRTGTPRPRVPLATPYGLCTYISGPGESDDAVRLYMGANRVFTVPAATPWRPVSS